MKILMSLVLISVSSLYASMLKVVNDEIVLSINAKQYVYQVGEYPLPKNAIQVCYVSGKGKVILNNDKNYILDRNSSFQCYQVPEKKKDFFSLVVEKLTKSYGSELIDINPTIKSAAGTRSISSNVKASSRIFIRHLFRVSEQIIIKFAVLRVNCYCYLIS